MASASPIASSTWRNFLAWWKAFRDDPEYYTANVVIDLVRDCGSILAADLVLHLFRAAMAWIDATFPNPQTTSPDGEPFVSGLEVTRWMVTSFHAVTILVVVTMSVVSVYRFIRKVAK